MHSVSPVLPQRHGSGPPLPLAPERARGDVAEPVRRVRVDEPGFVDAVRRLHADQARQHFEEDLRPYGPARRDDMVVAIGVLTSVESWQQFRHTFDRSLAQTNRAWRTALAGIFAGISIDVVEGS